MIAGSAGFPVQARAQGGCFEPSPVPALGTPLFLCDLGVDLPLFFDVVHVSFFETAVSALCDLGGFGCSIDECGLNQFTQDLFAGATLGEPSVPDGSWSCDLGGRGQLIGEAALCLLADLANRPTADGRRGLDIEVPVKLLGVLDTSVKQHVGVSAFDPGAQRLEGFHSVSFCVPFLGCIENIPQPFTAQLVAAPPVSGPCGDFPFRDLYALRFSADELDFRVGLSFPPIPIATPIGAVNVQPRIGGEIHNKAVFSPYDETSMRTDLVPAPGCPDAGDVCFSGGALIGLAETLTDVYATDCGALLTTSGRSWSSQVGLGGRNPAGELWEAPASMTADPLSGGRPDLVFGCEEGSVQFSGCEGGAPECPREEDFLTPPRTAPEKSPAGQASASLRISYNVLDAIAPGSAFEFALNFLTEAPLVLDAFTIFVEPAMGARYASQFDVAFMEGVYSPTEEFPVAGCELPESVARVVFPSAVAANSFLKVTGGFTFRLKLRLKVTLPFVGKINKTITIFDLGEDDTSVEIVPEDNVSRLSVAYPRPGDLPTAESRIGLGPAGPSTDPRAPTVSRFVKFSDPSVLTGAAADQAAQDFLEECRTTPVVGAVPSPLLVEAPEDERLGALGLLGDEALFPCNLCLGVSGEQPVCVIDNSDDPDLPAEEVEQRSQEECELRMDADGTPFCEASGIFPCVLATGVLEDPAGEFPIQRRFGTVFPVSQEDLEPEKRWACDSARKGRLGCFDACTFDPASGRLLRVARSAVDIVHPLCGEDLPDPVLACDLSCEDQEPCECDDGNPCTVDICNQEFGCVNEPELANGAACEDGLFCTQGDVCDNGRCVGGSNPCAEPGAAGPVCDELAQSCGTCGNDIVEDGEECDGFDSAVCAGRCLPPGHPAACTCANRPPSCANATIAPAELWPPNHRFEEVSVAVTDPDGDPVDITIDSIFQDEPLNGLGDGDTCPDGLGLGGDAADLRAERAGTRRVPGDGRVYHVGFTAADGFGGECSGTVSVCVPHDQRPGHVCVDQGPLFDSTSCQSASAGIPAHAAEISGARHGGPGNAPRGAR